MGVLQIDTSNYVTAFHEKPQLKRDLNKMSLPAAEIKRLGLNNTSSANTAPGNRFLGSMGIYLFKREALLDLLKNDTREDFGKHLIPTKVQEGGIAAYIHQGYWEDIGTIASFYNANMALTTDSPPFDCYNEEWRIFSNQTTLPGAKISNTQVKNSILCEGAIIDADEITHSIIGPRTIIGNGCIIRDSYIMGNDCYSLKSETPNLPHKFSIGENCIIRKTIIDKHVLIGNGVQLINKEGLNNYDSDIASIRDGIIIIPRGATLPDGFIL
jgi:glucose-1-phosphate adenylyltransferase